LSRSGITYGTFLDILLPPTDEGGIWTGELLELIKYVGSYILIDGTLEIVCVYKKEILSSYETEGLAAYGELKWALQSIAPGNNIKGE